MSAIDIRYIVNVLPSTLPPGAAGLDLLGLLLTRNQTIPIGGDYGGVLKFPTAADVGAYFGTTSDEYEFAVRYFLGTDVADRRPRGLLIGAFPDQPQTAWVRGAALKPPLLSTFRAITAGELSISFSGTVVDIEPVNLSTVDSFTEIAEIVQAAIRAQAEVDPGPNTAMAAATFRTGSASKFSFAPLAAGADEISLATVTWNANTYSFEIRGGGEGTDGQTISDISGNLADAMQVSDDYMPAISDGTSGKDAKAILEGIKSRTQNFATYTTLWNATREEKVTLGEWQASYPNYFMYVPHDDDPNLTIFGNTDNDASILRALDIDCAFMYGSFIYSAFVMGMAASINYQGSNSTMTFAHRSQTGLPYAVSDTPTAQALEDKGVNFYGNYALRNDEFHFLFPGRTLGSYRFIDHYVNSIWFFSALETSAAYGLNHTKRIPYNDAGLAVIRSFYQTAITAALNNGVIDTGVTLSDSQKAIIIAEVGRDITRDLFKNGYYLEIRQPDPSARIDRDSTDNALYWTYGGSVHRLDLTAKSLT